MPLKVKYIDLGLMEYAEAWDHQEKILKDIIEKKEKNQEYLNHFLVCEHPHVYTLGKSGKENNLLINQDFLEKINASYYKSNRGGDITYHGPGQIVGYPVLNLNDLRIGIRQYISFLEEVIIQTLGELHIKGERLENATGVWLDTTDPKSTRKICAIGVRVSKQVTMHGFAFNVNTNLDYFSYIHACGFVDKGVTSIENELHRKISIKPVIEIIKEKFEKVFHVKFV